MQTHPRYRIEITPKEKRSLLLYRTLVAAVIGAICGAVGAWIYVIVHFIRKWW